MSTIVDTSVFCGHWPFRRLPVLDPKALKGYLQARGVQQAWLSPTEAVLCADPMQANEPLFDAVQDDAFFMPVPILNPTLATWRRDAESCLARWPCRAFKLTPNYHQVDLSGPQASEFCAFAEEDRVVVCVQVRMMDERTHHPLMHVPAVSCRELAKLAGRHPNVRFLACACGRRELQHLRDTPNVWAELSFVESGQTLRNAMGMRGAVRLVFGSHSPFLYFEATAEKLNVTPEDVPADHVQAIRAENVKELLGPLAAA